MFRSSHPDVSLIKSVVKICRKFRGEHTCRNVISIKLLCKFIENNLRHRCSPVHLLNIFRTPFTKNTSGWLLLNVIHISKCISKWWSNYGIFIKATDWTRSISYWNMGLYETYFTENYNTVGYVKNDSNFMVLFNLTVSSVTQSL